MRHLPRFVAGILAGLVSFAATTSAQGLTPPIGQGAMGGHYTLAQIEANLNKFARDHALRCIKFPIGKSVRNKVIWAVKISDYAHRDENEPEVLFDGLHHGNEPMSASTTLFFMDWLLSNYGKDAEATHLVNSRELYFVPALNPDAYELNYLVYKNSNGKYFGSNRRNVNDVDLNRNWPTGWQKHQHFHGTAPLSEPETAALHGLIQARKNAPNGGFVLGMSSHASGELLLYPWGYKLGPPTNVKDYELLSEGLLAKNPMRSGPLSKILYIAKGNAIDHYHAAFGMFGFTPELGNSSEGKWPKPAQQVAIVNRHLPMYRSFAHMAAAFVKVDSFAVTEQSSRRGKVWPGDNGELRITMQNYGRLGTTARLQLRSLTPGVQVTTSTVDYRFNRFQKVTNTSTPFRFAVNTVFSGTTARFELSIGYGGPVNGFTRKEIVQVPLGRMRRWGGGTTAPEYGSVVGVIGDWNGDGYNDFAFGTPSANRSGTSSGLVQLVSGKDHTLLDTRVGAAFWKLGSSIDGGDINGDGKADMVFGIPGYNLNGFRGAVGVQFGGQTSYRIFRAAHNGLGERVASGGDLDGDGHDDVLVTSSNVVYAYSGKRNQYLWNQSAPAAIRSIDVLGDIDNDGRDDFIIGMPAYNGSRGLIEIRSGKNGARIRAFGGQTVERLGLSVANVGDIDGDHVDDYMFGSPNWGGNFRGNAAIQSGRTGSFLRILWGTTAGMRFGSAVSAAGGDIDGDGTPDVLVSSQPTSTSNKGMIQAFSGRTGKLLRTITGRTDRYGEAVRGVDTNGDDDPDFVIGEPFSTGGNGWIIDCPPKANPPAFRTYGKTCKGSGDRLPRIGHGGSFRVAQKYTVTLSSAPGTTIALLKIALNERKPPVPLDFAGAPGCQLLYKDSLFTLGTGTDSRGHGRITLPVPDSDGFVGLKLYWQWLVYDPSANRLKLTFSNAAESTFGAR